MLTTINVQRIHISNHIMINPEYKNIYDIKSIHAFSLLCAIYIDLDHKTGNTKYFNLKNLFEKEDA